MTPALKTKEARQFYNKFHIHGCGNLTTLKLNAIFIGKGNTREHEQMKFDLAWEAKSMGDNFITEGARKAFDDEKEIFKVKKDKIVDFVNLSQQQEYEIIHKHESDAQIKYYRGTGVVPMIIGETIICDKCREKFPRRNKGNICQECKNE